MIEEESPHSRRNSFTPAVLDMWGVAELQRYIAALQAEIARAEAAIAAREKHRNAADSFFRRP